VFGGDAVNAEESLEKEFCDAIVFLGERGAWIGGKIAEELGMCWEELFADCG